MTDISPESLVGGAEAVAERWVAEGHDWLVAHGLEDYPAQLGRDLDILMDPRDARAAFQEAREVLSAQGWTLFVRPPSTWGVRLVALRPIAPDLWSYLEFHTVRRLTWALMTIADLPAPLGHWLGPFPTSHWVKFAKGVIIPLLAGDIERFDEQYIHRHSLSLRHRGEICELLSPRFGRSLSLRLLSAVDCGSPPALVGLSPALRRAALRTMLRTPADSLRNLGVLVRRRVGRLVARTGMRVALEVPAPSDEFVAEVANALAQVFVTIEVKPTGSLFDQIRRQYRVLCRQSVVLEVETTDSREAIRLGVAPGLRRRPSVVRLTPRTSPRAVASWIIAQWAGHHAYIPSDR